MSTQSISGLWQLFEVVEDELVGERDCKVKRGPGEAQTDELLVSGVWPTETHAYTKIGTQCEFFYISVSFLYRVSLGKGAVLYCNACLTSQLPSSKDFAGLN